MNDPNLRQRIREMFPASDDLSVESMAAFASRELWGAADIAHREECLACFDSGKKLEGCDVVTEIEQLIRNRAEV